MLRGVSLERSKECLLVGKEVVMRSLDDDV
jgi:hypothetical protein